MRSSNEYGYKCNYPDYNFRFLYDDYTVTSNYYESCHHCYYSLTVSKNGVIKDIRLLKKLLTKITDDDIKIYEKKTKLDQILTKINR